MRRDTRTVGRPRVGTPISITLTDEQRDWIDARIPPGGTRTQAVRAVIQAAMDAEAQAKGKRRRP